MEHQVNINVDRPEEGEKLSKQEEREHSNIAAALAMLASTLDVKFTDYSGKRHAKEKEWMDAERQYAGVLDQEDEKILQALGGGNRTTQPPVVNITRQKTNIAIARMQDIQFPSGGDYNFIVAPTEVPELKRLMQDNSQPADAPDGTTVADMAYALHAEAFEAARKMQNTIRDRFTEADYGKKARCSMGDLCRLGTAVLKGPVHRIKLNKNYIPNQTSDGGVVRELSVSSETIPTVQWVDPRMWYPDPNARPGTTIDDCFEVHLMTPREVAKLARNPAYMRERVRDVLSTEPDATGLGDVLNQLSLTGVTGSAIENRYVVKEYHGALDKKVLKDLGLLTEEQEDDVLFNLQGEVWFCNGTVIRISLSPIEGDDNIPYLACQWEEDKSSVFGHGIPYLMRHAQRVVNSSWLMLLDNAGLTAGPQIVLNREMIQPANAEEGWKIAPMKIWFLTEYGASVNEAMQFVNVPTQQESIGQIIEFAMSFADVESSIPQIQAGEMPQGNNTMGGVAMVLTASHIIQQRVSERWDDNITVPLVKRFFHWEMQYNDDPAIHGDVEVKAGGATERIDKQIKSQDLERILGLAGTNEEYLAQIDPASAFRELVATTRAGDILKDSEQVARDQEEAARAAQQAPPDPDMLKAQAAQMAAEAKIKEIEGNIQLNQMRIQLEQAVAQAQMEKEQMALQVKREENMVKLQLAQMERELEIIKLAGQNDVSQAQILKDLEIAAMSDETSRLLKAIDHEQFQEEIKIKKIKGTGI